MGARCRDEQIALWLPFGRWERTFEWVGDRDDAARVDGREVREFTGGELGWCHQEMGAGQVAELLPDERALQGCGRATVVDRNGLREESWTVTAVGTRPGEPASMVGEGLIDVVYDVDVAGGGFAGLRGSMP